MSDSIFLAAVHSEARANLAGQVYPWRALFSFQERLIVGLQIQEFIEVYNDFVGSLREHCDGNAGPLGAEGHPGDGRAPIPARY